MKCPKKSDGQSSRREQENQKNCIEQKEMKVMNKSGNIAVGIKDIAATVWMLCMALCSNDFPANQNSAETFMDLWEIINGGEGTVAAPRTDYVEAGGQEQGQEQIQEQIQAGRDPLAGVPIPAELPDDPGASSLGKELWGESENENNWNHPLDTPLFLEDLEEIRAELGDSPAEDVEDAQQNELRLLHSFSQLLREEESAERTGEQAAPSASTPSASQGDGGPKKKGRKRKIVERQEEKSWQEKDQEERALKELLRSTTMEQLETVINANIAAVQENIDKHNAELAEDTGCKVGSLEWISSVKAALEGAVQELAGSGDSGGETQAIVSILKKANERYDKELEERRSFGEDAINNHLSVYLNLLNGFLGKKEVILEGIRRGGFSTKREESLKKELETHLPTFRMAFEIIKKSLKNMAEESDVPEILKISHILVRVNKTREYRKIGKVAKAPKVGRPVNNFVHHLKSTLFFMPTAISAYDYSNRQSVKLEKAAAQEESPAYFSIRRRELQERLQRLLPQIDNALRLGHLSMTFAGGPETNVPREELAEARVFVLSKLERLAVIGDVYDHLTEHYKEYKKEEMIKSIIYMQGTEAYIKAEAEKGGGRLVHALRVLYRMMTETGHGEAIRKEQEEGVLMPKFSDSPYQKKLVTTWVKTLDYAIRDVEVKMIKLWRRLAMVSVGDRDI